jgi:hypothetical protein
MAQDVSPRQAPRECNEFRGKTEQEKDLATLGLRPISPLVFPRTVLARG